MARKALDSQIMKAIAALMLLAWVAASLALDQPFGPREFTLVPNIKDADPFTRTPVMVQLPTRLKVVRTNDFLAITTDANSLKGLQVTVGARMVLGVRYLLFVHAEGEARGNRNTEGLSVGPEFQLGSMTSFVGVPEQPGRKTVVEMDLMLFETDVPAQHMWSPYSDKFKVLWKRTLREVIK